MDRIAKWWDCIYGGHMGLAIFGAANFLLFIVFLTVLMEIDDRMIMGVNVWLKPAKFAFSLSIFSWTAALLLPLYPYSSKKRQWIGKGMILFLAVEIIIISLQAGRGELSHFNQSTVLNSILFQIMATAIALFAGLMLLMMVDTFRLQLKTSRPIQDSIRWAWVIAAVTIISGFMMGNLLQHSVGVADGGDGLPLVNWSTEGGDLRVAHFFALHALQLLPLLAIGLAKSGLVKSPIIHRSLVNTFSFLYLVFVLITFYRALNGQALLPFFNLS